MKSRCNLVIKTAPCTHSNAQKIFVNENECIIIKRREKEKKHVGNIQKLKTRIYLFRSCCFPKKKKLNANTQRHAMRFNRNVKNRKYSLFYYFVGWDEIFVGFCSSYQKIIIIILELQYSQLSSFKSFQKKLGLEEIYRLLKP